MLVDVNHQRGDGAMPAEGPDLVQPEAGALPEFRRLRDARMPERMKRTGAATAARSNEGGESR
jgi:hypothetical protein